MQTVSNGLKFEKKNIKVRDTWRDIHYIQWNIPDEMIRSKKNSFRVKMMKSEQVYQFCWMRSLSVWQLQGIHTSLKLVVERFREIKKEYERLIFPANGTLWRKNVPRTSAREENSFRTLKRRLAVRENWCSLLAKTFKLRREEKLSSNRMSLCDDYHSSLHHFTDIVHR